MPEPTVRNISTSFFVLLRTLANFYGWKLAKVAARTLDNRVDHIRAAFYRVAYGLAATPHRWSRCVALVDTDFGPSLDRLYIARRFAHGREEALAIGASVRDAFARLIQSASWMTRSDRLAARRKLARMSTRIGYPDYLLNDTFLHAELDGMVAYDGELLRSAMENRRMRSVKALRKLWDRVDRKL